MKTGEKLARQLRRIVKQEIAATRARLRDRPSPASGEAIHEARKCLKKIRAILRLLRGGPDPAGRRREAEILRAMSRALSRLRDAEVLVKAAEKLGRNARGGAAAKAAFSQLRRNLRQRHAQLLAAPHGGEARVAETLARAAERAGRWLPKNLPWPAIVRGLRRSYRRVRKAMNAADETRSDADLHEWRKRVKDLWYQLRVVRCLRCRHLRGLCDHTRRLGDWLGEHHDLVLLEAAVRSLELDPAQAQFISHRIGNHRQRLQRKAFVLGRRVSRRSPAKFAHLIKR